MNPGVPKPEHLTATLLYLLELLVSQFIPFPGNVFPKVSWAKSLLYSAVAPKKLFPDLLWLFESPLKLPHSMLCGWLPFCSKSMKHRKDPLCTKIKIILSSHRMSINVLLMLLVMVIEMIEMVVEMIEMVIEMIEMVVVTVIIKKWRL